MVTKCVIVNDIIVNAITETAFNPEYEAAVIEAEPAKFTLFRKIGCDNVYKKTETFKAIFDNKFYNDVVDYVRSMKGVILSKDNNSDTVMKAEKLRGILGNVRLVKLIFVVNTLTNGSDCDVCEC